MLQPEGICFVMLRDLIHLTIKSVPFSLFCKMQVTILSHSYTALCDLKVKESAYTTHVMASPCECMYLWII